MKKDTLKEKSKCCRANKTIFYDLTGVILKNRCSKCGKPFKAEEEALDQIRDFINNIEPK